MCGECDIVDISNNYPHNLRHVFDIDVICAYSYLFRILK